MKLELLAPAGSIAGMKAVIAAGADAVYIGGNRFGARAYAENPGEEELVLAIRYAHLRGVRVYLTVNTLLRDEELAELKDWLTPYVEAGLDAVLVQDLGVLRLLRREFPDLTLHASTQMAVTGPEGAMLLRKLGVSRVVPAREMSLRELSGIRQMSGLEVEAFIHGALCVCFSGQCLFSSLLGGRSGNRGRCAQPCRLPYRFFEGWQEDARRPGAKSRREGELLSPKDLCALDLLPQMAASGVVSFKIEGRMKQPAYAAGVVEVYRKYLDLLEAGKPYRVDPADRKRLYTLFNRGGFTDGYFTRRNGPEMMTQKGRVLTAAEEQARAELYARMDETYVLPEDTLGIRGEVRIFAGRNAQLTVSLADLRGALANVDRKGNADAPCTGKDRANADGCPEEGFKGSDYAPEPGLRAAVCGDEVLPAKNAPLSEERIRDQLAKTGGSGFSFRELTVLTDGKAFLPARSLNDLRRKALAALEEEILRFYPRLFAGETGNGRHLPGEEKTAGGRESSYIYTAEKDTLSGRKAGSCLPESFHASGRGGEALPKEPLVTAVCDTLPQALAAGGAGADRIFLDAAALFLYADGRGLDAAAAELVRSFGRERLFIATPLAERAGAAEALYDQAEALLAAGIGGFLIRSFEAFAHMRRLGFAGFCLVDAPVYTWNKEARAFVRELGFAGDTAPYELSRAQLARRMAADSRALPDGRSKNPAASPETVGSRPAAAGSAADTESGRLPLSAPKEWERTSQEESAAARGGFAASEIQIYGRQTLMVTAQCLRKNSARCTKHPGLETLVDRTGASFPVRCNCTFCSNIIYNSVPHSLFREIPFFRKLGFSSLRLAFTTESPEEAGRLVKAAASRLRPESGPTKTGAGQRAGSRGKEEEPVSAYTKGQYTKGVE